MSAGAGDAASGRGAGSGGSWQRPDWASAEVVEQGVQFVQAVALGLRNPGEKDGLLPGAGTFEGHADGGGGILVKVGRGEADVGAGNSGLAAQTEGLEEDNTPVRRGGGGSAGGGDLGQSQRRRIGTAGTLRAKCSKSQRNFRGGDSRRLEPAASGTAHLSSLRRTFAAATLAFRSRKSNSSCAASNPTLGDPLKCVGWLLLRSWMCGLCLPSPRAQGLVVDSVLDGANLALDEN